MSGLPGLGIQPLSAALAGGCFTEPPGKSYALFSLMPPPICQEVLACGQKVGDPSS